MQIKNMHDIIYQICVIVHELKKLHRYFSKNNQKKWVGGGINHCPLTGHLFFFASLSGIDVIV